MKNFIKQILLVGSLFAFLLGINGCGQKGSLYLPKESQTQTNKQNNNSFYVGSGLGVSNS